MTSYLSVAGNVLVFCMVSRLMKIWQIVPMNTPALALPNTRIIIEPIATSTRVNAGH